MTNYSEVLIDSIEREINGQDYICSKADKELLHELLNEINSYAGTNFHYLAELDAFSISGAGNIVAKYITEFSSEDVKGYLSEEELYEEAKLCDEVLNNQRKYVYTFFCRLKRRDNVDILSDDVRDKAALNKLRDKYLMPVEEVCTIYDILHNILHAMLDELDDGIYSSINCPDITEIEIIQRINKTLAYINGEDAMLLQFTYGNCDKTIITLL